MGHHSAAYTLDAYGHLIDNEVGVALNLEDLGLAADNQYGSARWADSWATLTGWTSASSNGR
jgi:hypothetical protein